MYNSINFLALLCMFFFFREMKLFFLILLLIATMYSTRAQDDIDKCKCPEGYKRHYLKDTARCLPSLMAIPAPPMPCIRNPDK